MPNGYAIECIRHTLATRPIHEIIAGDKPGAPLAFQLGWPDEQLLQGVARDLRGLRSGPGPHRPVPAASLPPIGISSGQMTRCLGSAAKAFADLVCCHQQPLAMRCAGGMKLLLLGVGPIPKQLSAV